MEHERQLGEDENVPLGQVTIRQWEITANSTRYERLQAAPSDDDLITMWTLWVVLSGLVAIFVSLVLLSIVCDRNARKNIFNWYLVYLMIPDVAFSFFCAWTCAFNAVKGEYFGVAMCQFQSFYLTWGIAGNSWLNMVIARQLHLLLQSSVAMRRYRVPTRRIITCTAMAVYVYSAFVASWAFWGSSLSWWPHKTVSISGLGCFPLEFSRASTFFYFLVYIPMLAGIPLVYVLYICFDIWRRNLMPPRGKRRLLAIYLFRVIAAYLLMWAPHLILCLAGTGKPWAVFSGGTWGHFQGVVSASISMTKPDVYQAFCRFIRCRCDNTTPASFKNDTEEPTTFRSISVTLTRLYSSRRLSDNSKLFEDPSASVVQEDSTGPAKEDSTKERTIPIGEEGSGIPSSKRSAFVEGYLPRQRADFTYDDEHSDAGMAEGTY